MTRPERAEALERMLVEHFPRLPLSPRTAFGPHGGTYEDHDGFIRDIATQTWASLDEAVLQRHHGVLHHIGSDVLAHYLPAWLWAALGDGDETGHLERSVIVALTPQDPADDTSIGHRFGDLTPDQRAVVAAVLEYLETRFRQTHARAGWRWIDQADNNVTPALDRYWRRLR